MSDFKETYKIPEELAVEIRFKAAQAAKNRRDVAEKFDAYSGFVEIQKRYFLEDVDTILDIITKLIMEGKLFIHTKVVARIKDAESAVYNDELSTGDKDILMDVILSSLNEADYTFEKIEPDQQKKPKSKKLDDVFGITVIADTEEELDILQQELNEKLIVHNAKQKIKARYRATHMEMYGKENEESPLLECQLKTRQHYIDSYDHTLYKVETGLTRKLYEEKKIDETNKVKLTEAGAKKVENLIQEFYDNGRFSIFTNVPRMWEATFNEDEEVMELKRLTEAQTLKRVYPSLVIHPEKTR